MAALGLIGIERLERWPAERAVTGLRVSVGRRGAECPVAHAAVGLPADLGVVGGPTGGRVGGSVAGGDLGDLDDD